MVLWLVFKLLCRSIEAMWLQLLLLCQGEAAQGLTRATWLASGGLKSV
jgi:hypothetical protein